MPQHQSLHSKSCQAVRYLHQRRSSLPSKPFHRRRYRPPKREAGIPLLPHPSNYRMPNEGVSHSIPWRVGMVQMTLKSTDWISQVGWNAFGPMQTIHGNLTWHIRRVTYIGRQTTFQVRPTRSNDKCRAFNSNGTQNWLVDKPFLMHMPYGLSPGNGNPLPRTMP